jgi:hypothetical protein
VTGEWELEKTWEPQATGEKMFFMESTDASYRLSALFPKPLNPAGKTLNGT